MKFFRRVNMSSNNVNTVSDIKNPLLSRREITCDFLGFGGKLGKIDAMNMISEKYDLDVKTIIPMKLKNHVGRPTITGLFYVYEDESLARKHIEPTIFTRLEKSKTKAEEKAADASNGGKDEETAEEENTKDSKGESQ